MADIEKLAQNRTRVVISMTIAFVLWQGGDIVAQLSGPNGLLFLISSGTKLIGSVAYAISAFFLFLFYRRVKKANAAATLKDDWNRLTAGLAVQYGFFFLIGAASIMYAASIFWVLSAQVVLQSLILIGVTSSLAAFTLLQHVGSHPE